MKLLLEKIFGEKEGIKFNILGYLFDSSKTFLNSKEDCSKNYIASIFILARGLTVGKKTEHGVMR